MEVSTQDYLVKVLIKLITNQLFCLKFRKTLNNKTDKIVKLRALNASMRHPLRMSTVWDLRKNIKHNKLTCRGVGVLEVTKRQEKA